MRIFVSHAAADQKLATKFVDMLQLGIGVYHGDIFYSSMKGAVRNGDFFVQNIITELNTADFVIALLSRSYFASHFCLAEAGAALARKVAGTCEFFSLVVPPASFSDLDGMLHGVQSGSILDRATLAEMKDRLQAKLTIPTAPGSHVWDQKRDDFLGVAEETASLHNVKDELAKLKIVDYRWCWEPGSATVTVYVKSKIRITFKNEMKDEFYIESGEWESGSDGIPLYQASSRLKWHLKPGGPESYSIAVSPGSTFNTWIGLAENVKGEDCLNRSGAKRTGTLHLHLKLNGHSLIHDMRF